MFRIICIALGAFLIASLHPAAAKHAFSFDEMMKLKRLGDYTVSPDGKWLVYAAKDVDMAGNRLVSHLWLMPGQGGDAKKLLAEQTAAAPHFSPDGKKLVFTSDKELDDQIWLADFDSVNGVLNVPKRLTSVTGGVDGPIWSPDGQTIAFNAGVYPDCADAACNTKRIDEAKNAKVKAQILTHLLYRHWNAYQEGMRRHLFVVNMATATVRDLTPGDYDVPPFSLGGQDLYGFSPDGKELAYTTNHDLSPATSTNNDLFTVQVTRGATRQITTNLAADMTPVYSPDGKYIAYRRQLRPGFESDRFQLVLYDRGSGQSKSLTENFDRSIEAFAWAPDSQALYFTSVNQSEAPIYRVSINGGGVELITGGFNDDLSFGANGMLYFTRVSFRAPSEIYRADRAHPPACDKNLSSEPYSLDQCERAVVTAVSHLNDAVLGENDLVTPERFHFTGAENAPIEGWLIKPPGFDPAKKYPLKFLIHGGPETPWEDAWSFRWNSQLFAASGYVVALINFHGSGGYGQEFTDSILGDWGGKPYQDLMLGLDYLEAHNNFIDPNRECALGASFGGYMINWVMGHTNRFKCLVSHDGMFNTESAWGTTEELWFPEAEFKGTPFTNRVLYRQWSPHLFANNFKTPTLVIHGQLDYRLDVSEGFQLFTTLQRLNIPSKMLYFPNEGHWVLKPQDSQLWYQTVNGWVDQWIGK